MFLDKNFSALSTKIKSFAAEFIQGFKSISGVKEFLLVILGSILLWFSMALYNQLVLASFVSDASIITGIAITSILALAVAAPSAPGFIGTFQFGCVFALCEVFSYNKEMALAYSIVAHLVQYFLVAAHGLYILKKKGLSFRELSKTS